MRSRGQYREDDREHGYRQMMTLKLIRNFYMAGQELKKFYIHNKVSLLAASFGAHCRAGPEAATRILFCARLVAVLGPACMHPHLV